MGVEQDMIKNNQNGFTHIAIAIVIVVIVAVGAVGYMVMNNNKSDAGKSSTPSASTPTSSSNSQATNKSNDDKAVKKAAKDHFALIYQKKTDEAYQITCQGFKDRASLAEFKSQLENGSYYSIDLSAIEYTSADVRNNQAKLIGPVGPLQPDTDLEVSLLKENSQWCIYGYKTT